MTNPKIPQKSCSNPNCDKPAQARGMCLLHYSRWNRLERTDRPQCSVENCHTAVWARGLCDKHYRRWKTSGDPLHVEWKSFDSIWDEGFVDYFWARVDKSNPDGCWVWQRSCTDGYGCISAGGVAYRTHRVSWALANGRLPTLHILHHCDNPPCVNPAHLYEGTDADNMRDCRERGRHWVPSGEGAVKSKLTDAKVREIKHALREGVSWSTLGKRYGVVKSTIGWIARGKLWKHVQIDDDPCDEFFYMTQGI